MLVEVVIREEKIKRKDEQGFKTDKSRKRKELMMVLKLCWHH